MTEIIIDSVNRNFRVIEVRKQCDRIVYSNESFFQMRDFLYRYVKKGREIDKIGFDCYLPDVERSFLESLANSRNSR